MYKIWHFVITGGPCSGKTTGLNILKPYFEGKGFKVIVVPETATQVIDSGIPYQEVPKRAFQESIFDISLIKEESTKKLAKYLSDFHNKDIIIFYDRGLMDGKAYIFPEIFSKILKERDFSEEGVKARYDAVFHLVTAADGAEEFYNLSNTARTETPEVARMLDKKTYEAWVGHKKLYRFDNSTDFKTKIQKLVDKVEEEIKSAK